MGKLDDTLKAYILGIVSVVLVVAVFFFVTLVVNNIRDERMKNSKNKYDNVYGTVIKRSGDYIVIDPIDEELGEELRIASTKEVSKGDFVLIDNNSIEIIASNDELTDITINKRDDATTTTSTSVSIGSTSTSRTTTSTTTTSSSGSTTTANLSKDQTILNYAVNLNQEVDESNNANIKDSIKSGFITVVDFIFYGGEIKGVTWNEISTATKAKVIYYTLLIDDKIDSKWPNYKETIGNKVDDIKAKLIAKYMEITTNLCNNNPNGCEQAKSDFQLLKSSLSLTWEAVKSAFVYGYDKTTTYLRTWYEVFSGKV